MATTILLVEDDALQRQMLMMLVRKQLGFEVVTASNGSEALSVLKAMNFGDIDAVLLDLHMPVMDGFEALQEMQRHYPDIPVVMLTASTDTEAAVKAMKYGASDFVVKPAEPRVLGQALENAMRRSGLAQKMARLGAQRKDRMYFSDLVGHDNGLSHAVMLGRKVAAAEVPVLLSGENGSGKELFARAIHGESRRYKQPFVAVNCGTMSEFIEAILFGDESPQPANGLRAGAPDMRSTGKIREADGGTLFLDDIHALPANVQIRLLHLLQHKEIEPLKGGKARRVNVRIISASERDLTREIEAGRFREDLYFRLNVLPIVLPPLRQRKGDILPLSEQLLARLAIDDGLYPKTLTPCAKDYLKAQRWPANVRELEGLLHRALIYAEGEEIDSDLLQELHVHAAPSTPAVERRNVPEMHLNLRDPQGLVKPMEQIEKEIMLMVLSHAKGNVTRAADWLGMAKSTFYRKIKEE